jgi:hypothetical protein
MPYSAFGPLASAIAQVGQRKLGGMSEWLRPLLLGIGFKAGGLPWAPKGTQRSFLNCGKKLSIYLAFLSQNMVKNNNFITVTCYFRPHVVVLVGNCGDCLI